MRNVNERGTLYVTVKFYDLEDTLFTPASAAYRVDCLTSGHEIRAWTDLLPAESVSFALTGDDNRIIDERHSREMRQLVVRFEDESGNEQKSQAQYRVDNLSGVS
jgi:hypothetical protein